MDAVMRIKGLPIIIQPKECRMICRRSTLISLVAAICLMSTTPRALDVTITWNDLRQRITGWGV